MDIMKNKDFNKDNFPCEYNGCTGTQVKFLGMTQAGIESAQFKCNRCNKYMKMVDGELFFTGRYNNGGEVVNETK